MRFLFKSLLAAMLVALLISPQSRAEDVATSDGRTFKNIKVTGETDAAVKIVHDGGISLVPKKVLKPEFLAAHELKAAPVTGGGESEEEEFAASLKAFKANVPKFTTKDGREFASKDITKVEPNGLKLLTSTGIVKLKFNELTTVTQAALNYDPQKAADYDAKAEKIRKEQNAAALRISNANSEVESFSSNLRLYLVQNLGLGWLCSADVLENRDVDVVTSRAGSPLSGPKVIYETRTKTETAKVGTIERLMVFGLPSFNSLPSDLQSRRQWSGKVYRIGNYSSTSATTGQTSVISAAHIDRAEAVRLLAKNGNSAFFNAEMVTKAGEAPTKSGTYTGTGFAMTADGYIGTAAHVVKGASDTSISVNGTAKPARVVAINEANDVAILKIENTPLKPLQLSKAASIKVGADLFCVGFPLVGTLGVNPKLTKGNLNSLTGMADDPHTIQMSVQIQPGNSGGPVCDSQGHVIAVVSKTASTIAGARGTAGAVPQNVNFAAKADLMMDLVATVPGLVLPTSVTLTGSPEESVLESCFLITVTVNGASGMGPNSTEVK